MLETFEIESRDRRNLVIVAAIVALLAMVQVEGTILVRVVVGVIIGTTSGIVFLLVTIVLNHYKPDY